MRARWLGLLLLLGCVAELPTSGCRENQLSCNAACVDPDSNRQHCGECGRVCLGLCIGGQCVPCPEGQLVCGDRCLDLQTDVDHCGQCGNRCPTNLPHGTTVCQTGSCGVTCEPAWGDCNGNLVDGCETRVENDLAHCGSCGRVCAIPGATESCAGGVCSLVKCDAGRANCDDSALNGCEVELATDSQHCGMCGQRCTLANATARCTDGLCTVASCDIGFADCNGNPIDGCEVNLASNPAHCGACGLNCRVPNATAACIGGRCAVSVCNGGMGDCNRNVVDGCETNLQASTENCGGCGNRCNLSNATAACANGSCAVVACTAGWGNCDNLSFNGCEADINRSDFHCGRCGNECGNASCVSGACRCTDSGYPVLCTPTAVLNYISCWSPGMVCSTMRRCPDGQLRGCSTASLRWDCSTSRCI